MRSLTAVLSVAFLASAAFAEETLRQISWSELKAEGKLSGAEVLPPDDQDPFERLRVVNAKEQPLTATVLTVEDPGVGGPAYAIKGEVRYEDVQGTGYLEMWSFFPEGGMFFSRTLGKSGPMGRLEGSSSWRAFALPFLLKDSPTRPNRLEVNVVLPGRGTVFLSPLQLVQYAPGEGVLAVAGPWWSVHTAERIALCIGVILGSVAALLGVLVSKGKARGFVMLALTAVIVVGATMLVSGMVAVLRSQPYTVSALLLIAGLLSVGLPAAGLVFVRRRYEELELRKMKALDAT